MANANYGDPMIDLAELLVLLHKADEPFATLSGRFRIWRNLERCHAAFRSDALRRGVTTGGVGSDCLSLPEESEAVLSLWRMMPDRARVEYRSGSREGSYGVRVGQNWWSWNAREGALSNTIDPSLGSGIGKELAVLFNPPQLLGAFSFVPLQRATRVGRSVVVVEAHPRAEPSFDRDRYGGLRNGLGTGAESYRFDLDAERGIILASHAFFRGAPFQVIEALAITFDDPLDDALFEFRGPDSKTL